MAGAYNYGLVDKLQKRVRKLEVENKTASRRPSTIAEKRESIDYWKRAQSTLPMLIMNRPKRNRLERTMQ